jgi:hypothetical protein
MNRLKTKRIKRWPNLLTLIIGVGLLLNLSACQKNKAVDLVTNQQITDPVVNPPPPPPPQMSCAGYPATPYDTLDDCLVGSWASSCAPVTVAITGGGTQVCYRGVAGSSNCPNTTSWTTSWGSYSCQSVTNMVQTWARTATITCTNPTPGVCACPQALKPANTQSCTCGGGSTPTCTGSLLTFQCARAYTTCGGNVVPGPSPVVPSPTPAAVCSGTKRPRVQLVGSWGTTMYLDGMQSIVNAINAKGYSIQGSDIYKGNNTVGSQDKAERYVIEITINTSGTCTGVSNNRATGSMYAKVYRNNNLISTSGAWTSAGKGDRDCNSIRSGNYVKSVNWASAVSSLGIAQCQN